MQILLDTIEDSPEELNLAREIIRLAAARRSVPEGTIVGGLHIVLASEQNAPSYDLSSFGKAPLPADAIAIDVPDSFTAPAATPAACVTGVPAAPIQAAVNALPVTTIAAATPVPAKGSVTGASPAPDAASPAAPTPSNPTAAAAVEEDSDGYVWDARIHSSSKKKHANGAWHLKRGVSPELVATVKSELRAAEVMDTAAANEAIVAPFVQSLVEQAEAALLAATSPVVPPPPPAPPAPPAPPVTPATVATLNFTPAQVAALGVNAAPTAQPANTTAVVPPAPAVAGTVAAPVPAAPIPPAASVPAAESAAPPPVPPAAPVTSATTSLSSFKELMTQVVTPAMQAKKITPTEISSLCKSIGLPNGLPDLLPDTQPPRAELARVADAVRRHIGAA